VESRSLVRHDGGSGRHFCSMSRAASLIITLQVCCKSPGESILHDAQTRRSTKILHQRVIGTLHSQTSPDAHKALPRVCRKRQSIDATRRLLSVVCPRPTRLQRATLVTEYGDSCLQICCRSLAVEWGWHLIEPLSDQILRVNERIFQGTNYHTIISRKCLESMSCELE
jgi:hypothetical protein